MINNRAHVWYHILRETPVDYLLLLSVDADVK
jgi:hypothetical protein